MENSTNTILKVIEGGIKPKELCGKRFVSAYVTDTRLMGALGMHIHWAVIDSTDAEDFHQFFYFDTEEYGFETYKSLWVNDRKSVESIEHSMIDCLGGSKIPVTETEARMLLNEYADFNESHDIEMPAGLREYSFLLGSEIPENSDSDDDEIALVQDNDFRKIIRTDGDGATNPFTPADMHSAQAVLFAKECTEIINEYQLVNYFLMRCFARDFFAARYLTGEEGLIPGPRTKVGPDENMRLDLYPDMEPATMGKNTIDEKGGFYICQSLVETDSEYRIIVSKIKIESMRVVRYERASGFKVTSSEAAMMLSRSEFVTVYELIADPEEIDEKKFELNFNTMMTMHEHGKLYLAFNENNNHVGRRVFMLSEDIFGMYYITDMGQFIAAAYSVPSIQKMEREIMKSPLGNFLVPTEKFEFKEPVLYEFINSDFDRFEDFLDVIRDD
ncbi:MAG: hypothetical protein LKJ83_00640 [Eubacteriaceae bacterium]|jgi:hypothetical protein|nr:hypothetical protein [Eubacteriaceae bacterium]